MPTVTGCGQIFQSTHPVRGATLTLILRRSPTIFQSTHPVRGATPLPPAIGTEQLRISIHAPREGCDVEVMAYQWPSINFNPRTP